ncbi:hypothetical protein PSI23_22020 [Xenorhabdus sp. XENO-10]|uniref:Uncharacterized protein n=1 Tax=Xenorhabdus yunnanensis TaxID=3025878 RepID=A0ABT5LN26_9GAMM|nr:hypothetical protein [Xenorhabdus yunnanensis]MDC9591871.1 hypothetical protein [Xenorhabdus yunnanensis]
MSEINKLDNAGIKCPFHPDQYKSQDAVAPFGSFPWAIAQVYLGW